MPDRLAGRLGVTPHEIFDEQWNIRGSRAERWHHNRNNIESVEKILTEGSGGDGSRQIPIRSSYQTDDYWNRMIASDSLKLALLQIHGERLTNGLIHPFGFSIADATAAGPGHDASCKNGVPSDEVVMF